jgi:hypothetical protein
MAGMGMLRRLCFLLCSYLLALATLAVGYYLVILWFFIPQSHKPTRDHDIGMRLIDTAISLGLMILFAILSRFAYKKA